jgi:hypothetical protein
MDQDLEELRQILRTTAVLSPESFSCAGQEFIVKHEPLISKLQDCLYRRCYTVRLGSRLAEQTDSDGNGDMTEELAAANAGRAGREEGWKIVEALDSGQIVAGRNGAVRRFQPGQYMTHGGPGAAPREGEDVSIVCSVSSTTLAPEFYFAFGETVSEYDELQNLVRLYWNIAAAGAAELIGCVTRELNRFQVPFRFKCVNRRAEFQRRDSAVLYVNRRFYPIVAMLAAGIHSQVAMRLHPDVPLFTRRLGPGLALAEDPGGGDSFGLSRSRILAEALWTIYETGITGEEQRLEEVARQFQSQGLSLDRPHLRAGSMDHYQFPWADA